MAAVGPGSGHAGRAAREGELVLAWSSALSGLKGRTGAVVDSEGNATAYVRYGGGPRGRVWAESGALGTRLYSYGRGGLVVSQTDARGEVVESGRDWLGRKLSERWLDDEGRVVGGAQWAYDSVGRLARETNGEAATEYTAPKPVSGWKLPLRRGMLRPG